MKTGIRNTGISIKTRSIITQLLLIIIPIVTCTFLLLHQFERDFISGKAGITYQYDRYIINALNTATRQMESMSNSIAGNGLVKTYVAMEPGEERDRFFSENIQGILKYSYNRYLPTHDIRILPGMTLDRIQEENTLKYSRSTYRLWTFSLNDTIPDCRFYYQFEGDNNVPALLVFQPSENMLGDAIRNINSINGQVCFLLGSDGMLLYAPSDASMKEDSLSANDADTTEGYTVFNGNKVRYRISCDALPLVFISTHEITEPVRPSGNMLPSLLICVLLVIGCIILSYQVFFKGITRKIIRLSDACESIAIDRIESEMDENGVKAPQLPSIPIMGRDEIGILSVSINNMLSRIGELTALNAQEVRTSQRTAYDMLAAQIHPHFIYNTLENLRMMAELNDVPQIADQLYALGRMLRLSISDASSTGKIAMEIEHAETYLQLQKMRLNDRLQYCIDPVPEEILNISCPRFLLQPVVENALKHGFPDPATTITVHISAGYDHGGINLKVKNNGLVITEERLKEIREALKENHPIVNTKGGIGLLNVNSRIHMFCGKDYGLSIDSDEENGTICILRLSVNG